MAANNGADEGYNNDRLMEMAGRKDRESCVFRGTRPRDDHHDPLELLFLHERGNLETIRLLMRGMPLPCTFGFPGTKGTVCSNYVEFVKNFHPSISIFMAHPLHPFTKKERAVVLVCSVAFNMMWSTYLLVHKDRVVSVIYERMQTLWYLTTKHVCIVLYSVLIRQLVICPCFYNSLLDRVFSQHEEEDIEALKDAAHRLIRIKVNGDRIILWLLVLHLAGIVGVVLWLATWGGDVVVVEDDEQRMRYHTNRPVTALKSIAYSEVYNFLVWFLKFTPLFLFLYPIHRDAWYTKGSLRDYLLCRRCVWDYKRTPEFTRERLPHSVQPSEGMKPKAASISSICEDVANAHRTPHGFHLSTIRTLSEIDSSAATLLSQPSHRRHRDEEEEEEEEEEAYEPPSPRSPPVSPSSAELLS